MSTTEATTPERRAHLDRRLRTIRRHWKLIALTAFLVALTAYGLSSSMEKQYEASASLLFRDPALDETLFGSSLLKASADPAREAATNVNLLSLPGVARRTALALQKPPYVDRAREALGTRPPLGENVIEARIKVKPEGQSDVASITFIDKSPRLAALVANVFANEYIAFRRDADRAKVEEAQELVTTQLAALKASGTGAEEGASLRRRSEQLQILRSLETGNAEIVQAARVPTVAASPKPIQNTILGGFFGLLLGVGLASVLARADRRLRETDEVEDIVQRPILGTIPQGRARRDRDSAPLPPIEAEAYRLLRANLRYFNVNREIRSVLVTSPSSGDGKTTVAWNLASAAAETGAHVLVIETDLRRPTMAKRFGPAATPGLTVMLAGHKALEEVVQTVALGRGAGAASLGRTMDVLVAGPLPPNPTDLIESDAMRDLIRFAESKYDLVIVDTPPTSLVSDAIPLTREVSGVIMVTRLGHTTVDGLTRLNDQLQNLGAPLLGVVINGLSSKGAEYGYYGYGSGDRYDVATDNDEFMNIVRNDDVRTDGND